MTAFFGFVTPLGRPWVRATTVLPCEHEDHDGALISYETEMDEAEYSHGVYSWWCPAGFEHNAGEDEL